MDRFRRDEQALGVLAIVLLSVGGLVAVLGITGAVLYANDYGLEATVVDKQCSGGGGGGGLFGLAQSTNEVTVKTKVLGIEHTVELPQDQCSLVQRNNFVRYHIQSGRTAIYEREGGACVYDTEFGPRGCDRET